MQNQTSSNNVPKTQMFRLVCSLVGRRYMGVEGSNYQCWECRGLIMYWEELVWWTVNFSKTTKCCI